MACKPPKPQPATYEDLCALPHNVVGEIINGELVVSLRPVPRHALATSYLGGELTGPFGRGRGGPGGWLILFEPELHLGDHVLVPDLAGWLRERMPGVPDTAWFGLRPDWVCESCRQRRRFSIAHTSRTSIASKGCPGCGSWILLHARLRC